jgi:acyl-coenzyme A synthetase/AMP-(fatty) acid ligase
MLGARIAARRFGIDAPANLIVTVPPQHMYGLELSVAMPVAVGAAADSGRPFFPEDVRAALGNCPPPRILVTTPFHLSTCVESDIDWPQIAFVISATAPLTSDLAERAERRMRTRVFEIYGCTEAGSMASRRTCDGPSWRWYDSVAVRPGAGPVTIDAAFLSDPVTLADVLEFDSNGGFRLIGRSSDMIKIVGKRASLADLNIKLNSIEGVVDGVLVAPDEKAGAVQRLAAVIVAPTLDKKTLLARLRKLVDPAFVPRKILYVERLPRNQAGKLPRRVLLQMLQSDTGKTRA